MIVDLLLIAGGLVLLVFGGDFLVKGAVNLALRLGIAPLVVGLTVVAFGTSAPEMVVSVSAALGGTTDIALGNVVGSNTANILVILAAAAVVAPIDPRAHDFRESWAMMIGASLLLIALAFTDTLQFWHGLLLLAVLAAVVTRQIMTARPDDANEPEGVIAGVGWPRILIFLALGLVLLPVGAQLLVGGAVDIARVLGLSEAVIGLTLVAVGTSLPELAASVTAALRGRADLALGNVIGSNIFNILCILGISSMIAPLPIPEQMLRLDLWVMLAVALLLGPFLFRGIRFGRRVGAGMLLGYAAYVWALL